MWHAKWEKRMEWMNGRIKKVEKKEIVKGKNSKEEKKIFSHKITKMMTH